MAKQKLYKFKEPLPDESGDERFIIIEDRFDEVLVQEVAVCKNMAIEPTSQYPKTDLIEVEDD